MIKKSATYYNISIFNKWKGSFVDYWSSLKQSSSNREVIFSKRNIDLFLLNSFTICHMSHFAWQFFSFWFFSKTKIVWKPKSLYFHISIFSWYSSKQCQYSPYNIQLMTPSNRRYKLHFNFKSSFSLENWGSLDTNYVCCFNGFHISWY